MKSIKLKYKKIINAVFFLSELILYMSFLYIDITQAVSYTVSSAIKFTGISLCLLYTFMIPGEKEGRRDTAFLRSAMFFTVISDLFILVLDYYLYGMITFCIVQSIYLLRMGYWQSVLYPGKTKRIIIERFIRNFFVTFVFILVFIIIRIKLEALLVITSFYFISILFNVLDSILTAVNDKTRKQKIYAFGMLLFLLCDFNVGLFNISDYVKINSSWFHIIYSFAAIAMWMFYLPAQVLIAYSGQSPDM